MFIYETESYWLKLKKKIIVVILYIQYTMNTCNIYKLIYDENTNHDYYYNFF